MKIALSRRLITAVAAGLTLFLLVLAKGGCLFPKKTGSFEYIRKGEALLDKGNYAGAITLFEKANAGSPGNKAITDDLIYAYSKHAARLADEEKYDDAVSYMVKAYGMAANAYTMQNLALTFEKKALYEARRGKWPNALDSFEKARLAAEDSNIASTSLGISLYNDAAAEFKAGRNKLSITLLKQAMLVYQDSHIFSLLGTVYYKLSDLERARFYFEKARLLDPRDKELAKDVRKVSNELEMSQAKTVRQSPHFDLRYDKGQKIDAAYVAGVLERAYFDVGKDLGYYPGLKTTVFFYSTGNFRKIFMMPSIVRAFYDGNMRIPMPETEFDEKELSSYLYHEYTHAVLSAITGNNCPPWLGEGIAVWEEVRWTRPGAVIKLPVKALEGHALTVQGLSDAFKGTVAEKTDTQLYYILAYTVADYIVDTWGLGGLRDALKRISDGAHAINAIDDEFSITEKEFDTRWVAYLRRKFVNQEGVS